MLPGPSVADIAGGVAVGAKVSVQRGQTVLVEDLPVWDVTLDATSDRTVKRQISFTTSSDYVPDRPLDSLNNYGHRVRVVQIIEVPDGSQTEVNLGWFLVDEWEENTADGSMSVKAVDLLRLIETDVAKWPSSPPKNQRLRAEIQRLVGKTLAVQTSVPNSLVDKELQFQTDRLANLTDLCASHGLDYGMRPDGFLHVWEQTSELVAKYTANDLVVDAPRQSVERKPNRFLAVGSKTSGKKETKWSFEAATTTEPFGKDYGVVRERLEVQSATGQAMVTRAANDALKQSASVFGKRSLVMVPDSRLELGDVAMFETPYGEPFVGRVVAFSLPVDRPDLMRVDVEIVG